MQFVSPPGKTVKADGQAGLVPLSSLNVPIMVLKIWGATFTEIYWQKCDKNTDLFLLIYVLDVYIGWVHL